MDGRIPHSRVVLVEVGTWVSRSAPRFRPDRDYPAFGLLTLAATLRAHGHQVLLVDPVRESWSAARLAAELRPEPPVAIGVSSYTEGAEFAADVIRSCRAALPTCPVVAGGPHFTFLPEEALDAGAEAVVLHEGEGGLVGVLEHLRNRDAFPLEHVSGVVFRRGGSVVRTAPRERISSLDHLPFASEILESQAQKPKAHLLTSRGCPGRCIFCASGAFSGRRLRSESAERIFGMLWALSTRRERPLFVSFDDDVFTVDRRRLRSIFAWAERAGLRFEWEARCRVDQLDREFVGFLAAAGCRALHLGVESADQSVLDAIDKRISLGAFFAGFSLLAAHGIEPRCSFMIGHHRDTCATIEKTILLASAIERYGIGRTAIGVSTPFPGTPLHERAEELGIAIARRPWRAYSTTRPLYDAPGFTADDLRKARQLFETDKERVLAGPVLGRRDPEVESFRARVLSWADEMRTLSEGRAAACARGEFGAPRTLH